MDFEDTTKTDYLIKGNEGCLGDSVYQINWSKNNEFSFAGVSFDGSVYFDVIPEDEKFKILL